MPHELQEQRDIGAGKLIALGSFDSRRPTVATSAHRSLFARANGVHAMRRYLDIIPTLQLRSPGIAERCNES
jgi:hypothetical protein